MDLEYKDYEKRCDEIRSINGELLELFANDLKNLSQKTVTAHVSNVDFYINNYLLYEDALTFEHGVGKIDDFLGYFFIRKCMWSTPGTIQSTATSIKKFYKSMLEHGKILKEDYDYLCEEIKTGRPKWQEDCAQFNNADEDNPFGFY